jgi:hypothetical protein
LINQNNQDFCHYILRKLNAGLSLNSAFLTDLCYEPVEKLMNTSRAKKNARRHLFDILRKNMFEETHLVSDANIKREKEKARRMRRTSWWNRKVDKGICYYCGSNVGRKQLTMDHVVPLSRGGKSKKGNIVPACKECNNKKKSLLPVEWNEYIRSLLKEPF